MPSRQPTLTRRNTNARSHDRTIAQERLRAVRGAAVVFARAEPVARRAAAPGAAGAAEG